MVSSLKHQSLKFGYMVYSILPNLKTIFREWCIRMQILRRFIKSNIAFVRRRISFPIAPAVNYRISTGRRYFIYECSHTAPCGSDRIVITALDGKTRMHHELYDYFTVLKASSSNNKCSSGQRIATTALHTVTNVPLCSSLFLAPLFPLAVLHPQLLNSSQKDTHTQPNTRIHG